MANSRIKSLVEIFLVTIPLHFACSSTLADQPAGPSLLRGFSWNRTGDDEWTESEDFRLSEIEGYAAQSDDAVIKRIQVQWEKPEFDELGSWCTISGKLVIPEKDPDRLVPINWMQAISVYMAIEPDTKPDWLNGMKLQDTVQGSLLVNRAGEFRFRIDTRQIKHKPDLEQRFQVGVALAKHQRESIGQSITWSFRDSAIPSSVQMMLVPRAPKLSPELAAVNRARGWPLFNRNTVDFIRAVNTLQRVGKDRALTTLEKHLEWSANAFPFHEDETTFWIIRVLFEPIELTDRIPLPAIIVPPSAHDPLAHRTWPLTPIAITNDIPFMLGDAFGGSSGIPTHPKQHIEWARRHGIVRDQPLHPKMNPLQAAELLIQSRYMTTIKKEDLWRGGRVVDSLRQQALGTVKNILKIPEDENLHFHRRIHWMSDAEWKDRLDEANKLQIHWSEADEDFVAGNR